MRAIIYTRQSIHRDESATHEIQETACQRFAKTKGWEVVRIFNEKGVSGRTITKRKEFQDAVGMVSSGEADVLLVWRWTRFARNTLDGLVTLKAIEDAGGSVECALESIDKSAIGKFSLTMLLGIGELESDTKAEGWQETYARRVEAGLPPHGKRYFGYDRLDAAGNTIDETIPASQRPSSVGYAVNAYQAEILKELHRKHAQGTGMRSLAAWLNEQGLRSNKDGLWAHNSVRKMMDNPFATGYFSWGGQQVKGAHEPIIAPEVFAAYQKRRKAYVPAATKGSQYALSGLVFCNCGSRMTPTQAKGGTYWRCNARKGKGVLACQTPGSIERGQLQFWVNVWLLGHHKEWLAGLPNTDVLDEAIETAQLKRDQASDEITQMLITGAQAGLSQGQMADALQVLKAKLEAAEIELQDALASKGDAPVGTSEQISAGLAQMDDTIEAFRGMAQRIIAKVIVNADKSVEVVPR